MVDEIIAAEQAQASASATPTTTTTTTAPPIPIALPRRYPNQTCENVELDRLGDEMDNLCKPKAGFAAICNGNEDKLKKIPCSRILLSLQQRQACLAARWAVQNKCFGGKPDPGHKEQIDSVLNGINNCEARKLLNCAKGHPMAGK